MARLKFHPINKDLSLHPSDEGLSPGTPSYASSFQSLLMDGQLYAGVKTPTYQVRTLGRRPIPPGRPVPSVLLCRGGA